MFSYLNECVTFINFNTLLNEQNKSKVFKKPNTVDKKEVITNSK